MYLAAAARQRITGPPGPLYMPNSKCCDACCGTELPEGVGRAAHRCPRAAGSSSSCADAPSAPAHCSRLLSRHTSPVAEHRSSLDVAAIWHAGFCHVPRCCRLLLERPPPSHLHPDPLLGSFLVVEDRKVEVQPYRRH